MKPFIKWLLVLSLFTVASESAHCSTAESERQVGFGFGTVSPYPASPSFPYALTAVLEGDYRRKYFGLSILATATSSSKVNGTYWFGSQGSYQQTFLEPRFYLSVFHAGIAFGLNLSQGSSGQIQSVATYGPMFGLEIPIGFFSVGADARYLFTSGNNPAPLSTVLMFRFRF